MTEPLIQIFSQQSLSQPSSVRPTSSGSFAMGLGLTNECNLACAFCYRDPARVDRLSLDQVRSAMESLPVRSVNLGTGENGMHPQFHEILGYLRTLPVKLTITSNGHSAAVLTDDELRAFHDIEFYVGLSLRARAGCATRRWQLEIDSRTGGALCSRLGTPVTFISVMMKATICGWRRWRASPSATDRRCALTFTNQCAPTSTR